ncbi:MAG: hypothetical protein ACO1N9_11030 [Flavobacterium sp.]
MIKYSFIILTVFLFMSCAKEKTAISSESVQRESVQPQAPTFEVKPFTDKVLLLSDDLQVYDMSGNSKNNAKGLYGLTFPADSISAERIDIKKSGDNCNAFNFVKIGSKINGWLNSTEVYGYCKNSRDFEFTRGGIDFKLYHAQNFGVGASDDDGLTGCNDITPIILYNSKFNVEAYIPLKDNTGKYPGKFLVLDENEGWYDKITDDAFEDNKLKLSIHREYQEGGAYFTIVISLSQSGYSAIVTDVKDVEVSGE